MLASFVIGFHTARIDNLLQTLRFLIKDHPEVVSDSLLILACQDTTTNLNEHLQEFRSLQSVFAKSLVLDMNLPCMQLPKLTNVAIDLTETDRVIILESDRILPCGYFQSVIEQLGEGVQITCRKMKKLLEPTSDNVIESGTFNCRDEFRDQWNTIGVRNMWSGNTAIWKSDFLKAGRMDETYVGYGWADSDMTNRMEKAGVKSVYRDETELHLWHPSATYGEGDQKHMFIKNGLHYCKTWEVPLPDWFRQEIAQYRKILI